MASTHTTHQKTFKATHIQIPGGEIPFSGGKRYPGKRTTNEAAINCVRCCAESLGDYRLYLQQFIFLDPNLKESLTHDFLIQARYHIAVEIGDILNFTSGFKLPGNDYLAFPMQSYTAEIGNKQSELLQDILFFLNLGWPSESLTEENLVEQLIGQDIPASSPMEMITLLHLEGYTRLDQRFKRRQQALRELPTALDQSLIKAYEPKMVHVQGEEMPSVQAGQPKTIFVYFGTHHKFQLVVGTTVPPWEGCKPFATAASQRRFACRTQKAREKINSLIVSHRREVYQEVELLRSNAAQTASAPLTELQILGQARRNYFQRTLEADPIVCNQRTFYHPGSLGQSYDGWTLAYKYSCWSCKSLFVHQTVHPEPAANINWEGRDNEDKGKQKPKGKCAEADAEAKLPSLYN